MWRFWGTWRRYRREAQEPQFTDGQIDWYHLASGRLAKEGWWVPQHGWWVAVDPETRRVVGLEQNLQFATPIQWGWKPTELWWTDDEPPANRYSSQLYLEDGRIVDRASAA